MALTPYRGAETFTVRDIAALLTCHNDPDCSGPEWARGTTVCDEWECVIAEAIDAGELQPVGGERKEMRGGRWKGERRLRRDNVRRWLKEKKCATDKDIPRELQPMGSAPQAPAEGGGQSEGDLHPKRETTYRRIIAALLAVHYGEQEIDRPYPLADEVLADCQKQGIRAPASRSTLGPLFEQLPPVQKADLE